MVLFNLVGWLRRRQMFNTPSAGVKWGFIEKPTRATAAKEAGQGMSAEETAVRPNRVCLTFPESTGPRQPCFAKS